jgi:hypothetical protein
MRELTHSELDAVGGGGGSTISDHIDLAHDLGLTPKEYAEMVTGDKNFGQAFAPDKLK